MQHIRILDLSSNRIGNCAILYEFCPLLEELYAGLPYALAPVLFDPPRLLQGAVAAAVAAAEAGAPGSSGGSSGGGVAPSSESTATFEIAGVGVGDPAAGLAAAAGELARLFPALGRGSAGGSAGKLL